MLVPRNPRQAADVGRVLQVSRGAAIARNDALSGRSFSPQIEPCKGPNQLCLPYASFETAMPQAAVGFNFRSRNRLFNGRLLRCEIEVLISSPLLMLVG